MKQRIIELKNKFSQEIINVSTEGDLFDLEKKYSGRKSEFNEILKNLKNLSPAERQLIGPLANNTKNEIAAMLQKKRQEFSLKDDLEKEKIDVTLPGNRTVVGHLNPISIVRAEIEDIFTRMGFEIADGPEVETEFYNFDALNIPKDHPARDMQDTFFVQDTELAM